LAWKKKEDRKPLPNCHVSGKKKRGSTKEERRKSEGKIGGGKKALSRFAQSFRFLEGTRPSHRPILRSARRGGGEREHRRFILALSKGRLSAVEESERLRREEPARDGGAVALRRCRKSVSFRPAGPRGGEGAWVWGGQNIPGPKRQHPTRLNRVPPPTKIATSKGRGAG